MKYVYTLCSLFIFKHSENMFHHIPLKLCSYLRISSRVLVLFCLFLHNDNILARLMAWRCKIDSLCKFSRTKKWFWNYTQWGSRYQVSEELSIYFVDSFLFICIIIIVIFVFFTETENWRVFQTLDKQQNINICINKNLTTPGRETG